MRKRCGGSTRTTFGREGSLRHRRRAPMAVMPQRGLPTMPFQRLKPSTHHYRRCVLTLNSRLL